MNITVLFLSRPWYEGWSHHGRTFSIYLCPLSFWLTLPRGVLSTSWCCPSRPCVVFLSCTYLALFLALSLSPDNSLGVVKGVSRRVSTTLTYFIHFSLSFWLTLPRGVLSTSWCCPSRPCVVFLSCTYLALFLALSLSPCGVTNDHSMLGTEQNIYIQQLTTHQWTQSPVSRDICKLINVSHVLHTTASTHSQQPASKVHLAEFPPENPPNYHQQRITETDEWWSEEMTSILTFRSW